LQYSNFDNSNYQTNISGYNLNFEQNNISNINYDIQNNYSSAPFYILNQTSQDSLFSLIDVPLNNFRTVNPIEKENYIKQSLLYYYNESLNPIARNLNGNLTYKSVGLQNGTPKTIFDNPTNPPAGQGDVWVDMDSSERFTVLLVEKAGGEKIMYFHYNDKNSQFQELVNEKQLGGEKISDEFIVDNEGVSFCGENESGRKVSIWRVIPSSPPEKLIQLGQSATILLKANYYIKGVSVLPGSFITIQSKIEDAELVLKTDLGYLTYLKIPGYAGIFKLVSKNRYEQVVPFKNTLTWTWVGAGGGLWTTPDSITYMELGGELLTRRPTSLADFNPRIIKYNISQEKSERLIGSGDYLEGEKIGPIMLIYNVYTPWMKYSTIWSDYYNKTAVWENNKFKKAFSNDRGEIRWINASKTFALIQSLQDTTIDSLIIYNGQSSLPFIKIGDVINGKKIAKIGASTAYGCTAEILTFDENNSPSYWRVKIPCILSAPSTAFGGETIALVGQNFNPNDSNVEVLLNNTPIKPITITDEQISFILPFDVFGEINISLRITSSGKTILSNPVTIKVSGSPTPQITNVLNNSAPELGSNLRPGDTALIQGSGFVSGGCTNNCASIQTADNKTLTPISASQNQISFVIPEDLPAPGEIWIRVLRSDGKTSNWVRVVLGG
jgi:hypothetical protein